MDTEKREKYFGLLDKEIQELINPETGLLDEIYSNIINCPLCNSEPIKHKKLFSKRGYTFVRCDECELIFSNPQVKEVFLNQFYGKSEANDLWVEIQESELEKSWKKDYFQDQVILLNNYKINNTPKVLDIGCSSGYFLEIVKKLHPSWSVLGLEFNKKAVEYAKNKNIPVEKKLVKDLQIDEKYDIFTMFGVLEHLPKPKCVLNQIKEKSNKNALVLAIVPNAYSLYNMFLQNNSRNFDGRNHLLYFSECTLKKLFEQSGYEVIHLDTVLTGIDNIKRQLQWLDPYSTEKTDRFIPYALKELLKTDKVEKVIQKYNLGLRLRILVRLI
jgi:2-polyprenyl-3-methyl-5-hydroxy-6-metoxy-1,4-benzoquinol methylase